MSVLNNSVIILSVLVSVLSSFVNSQFPSDPKPCKYGDSDCIVKLINYYSNEKNEGDSNINLVATDPLKISEIHIKQGAESPVNIDVLFTNNDLVGLKTTTAFKTKGFGKDLTGKHEIHIKFHSVSLIGDYKITGRVLVLPIKGNGKANMTLAETDVGLLFSGTPVEKNGEKYMKVKDMRITFKPGRFYYHFENLFGDKELSDNMNLFLNENWEDIFNEIKGSISSAFSKVFEGIVNAVFDKYPYDKYFVE